MLLPYICPITMLQLRGGRAAVVGERCGGRRQQDVDGRSFDARWASGREVVCGEGLGCGLVGVDARMLQPVARAKRRTGGGWAKDAAALDASSWQNLEWPIELPGVDGRVARGGRKRKKEKEMHTNCPQMQRESRRGKETSSQLPGMGGMLNGREVIASGKDGVCVWAGSILHHLLARDIHGPKSSVLSTPASAASRLGAQSTNDDPHARLPAAMLWSRTATT